MKRPLSGLAVAIVLGSWNWADAQSCVTPPQGLIAWWRAETNGLDSAGTNNATLVGGVGFANGEVGQGFSMSGGGNNYVALPTNVFPFPTSGTGTAAFSFEVWFKTTTGGVIVGQQDTAPFTGLTGWVPGLYVGTDGRLYGHMWEGAGMPPFPSSTNQVNDGKFHHAAVTYDGTTEALYLDGVDITNMPFTQAAYGSGTYYYQLGTGYTAGWPATTGGWSPFEGVIDEASIYNRALSAAEVASIFNAGSAGKCIATLSGVNSWISPTSGNWEDQASWSLGVLPNAMQSVALTNAGWKALAVDPNTAQNFPQSMRIQGMEIESPTNSFNVLLLNFSGFEVPLQMTSLRVGANSAVLVYSSMLEVNTDTNGNGGSVLLAGTVDQGYFAEVSLQGSLEMPIEFEPDAPPASYYLTNGTLTVSQGESIGGPQGPATFVQYGGNNQAGGIVIDTGGEFDLYGGQLTATNGIAVGYGELAGGANFYQYGGSVNGDMSISGNYALYGGTVSGKFTLGDSEYVQASVTQTGGTNLAVSMDLGHPGPFGGEGYYYLSNGVIQVASSVTLGGGQFTQENGQNTIVSNLVMAGRFVQAGIATEVYVLNGGTLSVGGLTTELDSTFQQNGGTNNVAGNLVLVAAPPPQNMFLETDGYYLAGGLLSAQNEIVNGAVDGGFTQTGGYNQITGQLTVQGSEPDAYCYTLQGGTLAVKDLCVSSNAFFQHTSGTIIQSGVLTLAGGIWNEETSGQQFGPLQVSSAFNFTNSVISLPTNRCILRFADSRGLGWSNGVTLTISNWNGSVNGGGSQQVIFGNSSSSLTAGQLSDVFFASPAGLPAGTYPARILSTGEIVPGILLPSPPLFSAPLRLVNGAVNLTVSGQTGWVFGVAASTDLVHWLTLSNQFNQSGTVTFQDDAAPSFRHRFYRAYIQP